jgi:hypothetical protein
VTVNGGGMQHCQIQDFIFGTSNSDAARALGREAATIDDFPLGLWHSSFNLNVSS